MKKIISITLFLVIMLLGSNVFATNDSLYFFEKQVQYELGAVYSSTIFPDSILDDFINRAINKVVVYVNAQADCILKQDTVILSTGTVQYSLNSDLFRVRKIHHLRYSRQGLDYIPLGDWGKNPSAGLNYVARFCALDEKQLLLAEPKPVKTDTLLVFYNAYPVVLSGDTANTDLNKDFREAIISYTLHLCMKRISEYDKATWYKVNFEKEMQDLGMTPQIAPAYDVVISTKVVKRQ